MGETEYLALGGDAMDLSVSSNGSEWVKHKTTWEAIAIFRNFQYPQTDRSG